MSEEVMIRLAIDKSGIRRYWKRHPNQARLDHSREVNDPYLVALAREVATHVEGNGLASRVDVMISGRGYVTVE